MFLKEFEPGSGGMIAPDNESITLCLEAVAEGKAEAKERLFELSYPELHRVARRLISWQAAGHTLEATALVNESAMRLMKAGNFAEFVNRKTFYAAIAKAMRCVLVDYARKRNSLKRGGEKTKVDLDVALEQIESSNQVKLLDLDEALSELTKYNERYANLVQCRFFLGMTVDEIAADQGVSRSTVERDWRFTRAWLAEFLEGA
ncbi:ECF-type sigma factor [Roseiconus sp. JC912]|uniref:ECF-type sigma factor n=1 Tax=Roseiconus sp. JC912 TaxID=3396307 RepID=UPI003A4C6052